MLYPSCSSTNLITLDILLKFLSLIKELTVLIYQDKSGRQPIPKYFQISEAPIICHKHNKPIKNTIFDFNKLVSDLDSMLILLSLEIVKIQNVFQQAGYVLTGNLKMISDSKIRVIKDQNIDFLPTLISTNERRLDLH